MRVDFRRCHLAMALLFVAATLGLTSAEDCRDDADAEFYAPSTQKLEPCVWLSARLDTEGSLCELHNPSGARDICPKTCGVCTSACEDTRNKILIDGEIHDCSHLAMRPWLQRLICVEGSDALTACPYTCDACPEPETRAVVNATAEPTFIALPIETTVPTLPPTSFSCDDDEYERFFVAATNKDEPCVWLRARPEYNAELCVEGSEARRICPETCGVCTDTCVDTRSKFVVDGVRRTCLHLSLRPELQAQVCVPGNEALVVCPETCDVCDSVAAALATLSPTVAPTSAGGADQTMPPTSVAQTSPPTSLASDIGAQTPPPSSLASDISAQTPPPSYLATDIGSAAITSPPSALASDAASAADSPLATYADEPAKTEAPTAQTQAAARSWFTLKVPL